MYACMCDRCGKIIKDEEPRSSMIIYGPDEEETKYEIDLCIECFDTFAKNYIDKEND